MKHTLLLAFPDNQVSTNALFRVTLLSGEKYTHLLSPAERQWQIPAQASALSIVHGYTLLGTKHILNGVDHLLFVAAIFLLPIQASAY